MRMNIRKFAFLVRAPGDMSMLVKSQIEFFLILFNDADLKFVLANFYTQPLSCEIVKSGGETDTFVSDAAEHSPPLASLL